MSSELLFTQPAFWVFMLVVMIALALLKHKIAMRNVFLFAASLFFYWKTSASFVFLLLFSTLADWGIAMAMARSETWKSDATLIAKVNNGQKYNTDPGRRTHQEVYKRHRS